METWAVELTLNKTTNQQLMSYHKKGNYDSFDTPSI